MSAATGNTLVLALDLGTSSTRSALFDQRGRRLDATTAQQANQLLTGKDGRAELAPAALLATATACIAATLEKQRADPALAGLPIVAVGTSCFWHSLVGVAADGAPLTPVYSWADSRCRVDAQALREEFDEHAVHARTGCMLRPSFWPAKLRWLRRTQRALFRRVRRWVSPAEWLYQEWCGESRCAHGMATGTGLYDPARLDWDPLMVKRCGLGLDQLPTIGDEPLATAPATAARFPALAAAQWFPAIGDGAANNLGAGATKPGLAALNFGTSAAVRIVRSSGRPRAPYGLFCYRIDARRFLIGGAITNAGGLRAWCLQQLRLPDDPAAIESALAGRPRPEHGLSVLPFWMAERAPTWRDDLSGAVVGISQATTALDLLQAISEASCQRLATIVAMIPGGRERLRFIVGGGLQHSPSGMQRLADILGAPLLASDEPETSLRGAAVFALEKLGKRGLETVAGRTIRPRAANVRIYARQRQQLAALERRMFP